MSSQPLAGRVAVVTGGTGGIGAAICKALAQAGAAVAVGYNSASEKAEAMLGELPGDGHMALRMPVTDSAALKDAIAAVDKRHARLDLLVNSAGITRFVPHGDLDGLDDALISRILDVNVRGVIASVRAARRSCGEEKGARSSTSPRSPALRRWGATSSIAPPRQRWTT